uniref:Uncharacterized protein n=1 Tax=Rhizophora mucronata TaxID=61149 RepID=A0A2P2NX96_RHIMU
MPKPQLLRAKQISSFQHSIHIRKLNTQQ